MGVALFLQAVAADPFLPPEPAPPAEEVVVTGKRDGGKVLTLSFEKVARTCDECKRTLARIEEMATPYSVKRRQVDRDHDAMVDNIDAHTKRGPALATEGQKKRLMERIPDHQRKDEAELLVMRRDVTAIVGAYLAQLEPIVIAAAEAERLERGASAVTKRDPAAHNENRPDITAAVVRRLNAQNFTIELPEIDGQ